MEEKIIESLKKTIRFEGVTEEFRQKVNKVLGTGHLVDEIINNRYEISDEIYFRLLRRAVGISQDTHPFYQKASSVYKKEKSMVYSWVLEKGHRYVRDRLSSLEFDDDLPIYQKTFICDGYLVNLEYLDCSEWYSPEDHLKVTIDYYPKLSIDALSDSLLKRGPVNLKYSRRVEALQGLDKIASSVTISSNLIHQFVSKNLRVFVRISET